MTAIARRHFLRASTAAILVAAGASTAPGATPIELPADHCDALRRRKRRIVVQQDVYWVMLKYAKMHPAATPPFAPFRDVAFSYVDEPGSQIDAIWWDIGGNASGAIPGSKVAPWLGPSLVDHWQREGIDWVGELVQETRRRNLEVFWNHRISEVEILPEGGLGKEPDPLKTRHPDWVVPTTWWRHGMWNLASPGLREHKVALLREVTECYDLDGLQIDFARHVPCLPVGRQWEHREHATEFIRMVRTMLLDVAKRRGRPLLLAARVPQTLDGCHADGFDVKTWAAQHLVDVLTLGSRSMDVDVEGMRAAVGPDVQLQPCFDDHHATDGYRYAPIEFLRGVFANHFQRGADSVVTFNWALGRPELAEKIGGEIAPLSHQAAFKEVGDARTMAGKDKLFAVERRGGYPWAEGFFNRNDTAPLPQSLSRERRSAKFTLHVSDAPPIGGRRALLTLCGILFQAEESESFEARFNGVVLPPAIRNAEWKDPQIFSPKPSPTSGGKGDYKINPRQRLLRLEWAVPAGGWKAGRNEVEISMASSDATVNSSVQIEKVEAHLRYL